MNEFGSWIALTETVMVKVKVRHQGQVLVHLGASVLLPCTHDQLHSLINAYTNLVRQALKSCDDHLEIVSQQILTIKSNIRKVYLWQQQQKSLWSKSKIKTAPQSSSLPS
jgi:prefoldin subunit 5